VWIDSGLPDLGPMPRGTYDEATMWWRHENLHRELLRDYATRIDVIKTPRESVEMEFIEKSTPIGCESMSIREALTAECFHKAQTLEEDCLSQIEDMPIVHKRPFLDRLAWQKFNKAAQSPVS
jgi:hypothetical protein